jgi:hypothetical protein
VRTPVDRFLLAKLEEKQLGFSPDAERSTLIRRASLDLLGLPPDPEALQRFLEDARPNAYELMIDELLKSPHYGERWGRHWLDAAGYVDGKLDNDLGSLYPNHGIWRYRDYVIRAFNEDMPFDRFLVEQLAGDELVDWRRAEAFDASTLSLLTATGFLRNVDDHTDFPQYGIEKRYEVVNETLDMFSTAVLGLTFECCRCHNHKYDPLPQRDYYGLMACFEPAFNVHAWQPPAQRKLADVSPAERARIDQHNTDIDKRIAELAKAEASTRDEVRKRIISGRLEAIPAEIDADVQLALALKPDQRTAAQQKLVDQDAAARKVTDAEIDAAVAFPERVALKTNADQRAALAASKKSYGFIQALWDVGPPPASHVHRRGNVKAHGVLVQPGFPEILQPAVDAAAPLAAEAAAAAPAATADAAAIGGTSPPQEVSAVAMIAAGETSGRRLALARWLTRPDHPLTARVFVNRVWHHHFGRGIVETLGNFGHSGSPPTHPELLDWLAVDFMENGWSVKRLHRQLMLSTAYRQTSRRLPAGEAIDPENRLLWRMNMRRLESEILRDSILAVSGALDRAAGGPPVEITNPPNGLSEVKANGSPGSPHRRSVYLFARRVYPLKFLEIFDAPIMPVNCTQRLNSATVLQSLALLNSDFLFAQADLMAERTRRLATDRPHAATPGTIGSAASSSAASNPEASSSKAGSSAAHTSAAGTSAAGTPDAVTGDAAVDAHVELAFRLAFARRPTAIELTASREFLHEQRQGYMAASDKAASDKAASDKAASDKAASDKAANDMAYRAAFADLCHMLLSSNEFLYVE